MQHFLVHPTIHLTIDDEGTDIQTLEGGQKCETQAKTVRVCETHASVHVKPLGDSKKKPRGLGKVGHTFSPSTQQAKADGCP